MKENQLDERRELLSERIEKAQDELDNLNLSYSKDFNSYHESLINLKEIQIENLWIKYDELSE